MTNPTTPTNTPAVSTEQTQKALAEELAKWRAA